MFIQPHTHHPLLQFSLSLFRHQLCLDYLEEPEERIQLIFSPKYSMKSLAIEGQSMDLLEQD